MILDELKITVDDSHWEIDHIVFLLNKYRAAVLKQRYSGFKREIPMSWYQQITIPLDNDPTKMKSLKVVPPLVNLYGLQFHTSASTSDTASQSYKYKITLVPPERFEYVHANKWLKDIIYCTIAYDNYLYLKLQSVTGITQSRPSSITLHALLDNPIDIIGYAEVTIGTNPLEVKFPVEESMLGEIISGVIGELSQVKFLPDQEKNNANEDNVQVRQTADTKFR
jgi:hypothetical protein